MTTPDLLPCPFCGQPKDWIDNQHEGLSPACTNQDCFAYAIPMYFCKEGALPTSAAPRWIPMTERKPKDGQIVAIFKPDALENDDEYETVDWNVRYNDLDISRHLWYPLPEPPKEVE